MKFQNILYGAAASLLLLASCAQTHENAEQVDHYPNMYPDYADVTIPVNIAPLNFEIRDKHYGVPDPEFTDPGWEVLDERKYRLNQLLAEGDSCNYLYDFGDSWQHVIAVERIEPTDITGSWCEVLDGARACPPEDSGGVPGYLQLLEAIQQSDTEAGRESQAWAGRHFDPELFDCQADNAAVQRICNNFWG